MIRSGLTITEALDTLIHQNKSPELKKILEIVLSDVKNGQSLSKSFAKSPHVFDQFYISMIHIGEESGSLDETLEFLAEQMGKSYSLQQKVRGALLYPILVFSTTFIMGTFIALFILPQLVDFFDAFEIELPLATQILLFVANVMKDYGVMILLGVGAFIIFLLLLLRIQSVKTQWHALKLKLPLFGMLFVDGEIARFARNLGTLLKSGVSITTAMETVIETMDNIIFQRGLRQILEKIKKGKQCADAMQTTVFSVLGFPFSLFPSLVTKMIAVGEKSGNLEGNLLYLADFYEEEIDNFSKNLSTILEPILLVVIGLIVGFVALAIISPIYELTGSIR